MASTAEAGHQVSRVDRLDPGEVGDILALAETADAADGAGPLAEHVLLHLGPGSELPATHLIIREPDGTLVGYGHVAADDAAAGPVAELVVHPMYRRRGLGRALVEAAIGAAERGAGSTAAVRLRVWAHGDHPSAAALAHDLGFERDRLLWQLRRSLLAPLPELRLPAGVSLRTFRPGSDDEAWITVNQRAFADHPEQGRWTLADLRVRLAEPWFDPAGFLLAVEERTGRLLGFHWTKVHDPIGEVYVLGVDPGTHGLGLGRALTIAGLRHLRDRGLSRVMLYVDESNTGAVALYTRLGFASWLTHVQYRLV